MKSRQLPIAFNRYGRAAALERATQDRCIAEGLINGPALATEGERRVMIVLFATVTLGVLQRYGRRRLLRRPS
jgi:hypothetical protein